MLRSPFEAWLFRRFLSHDEQIFTVRIESMNFWQFNVIYNDLCDAYQETFVEYFIHHFDPLYFMYPEEPSED